MGLRSDFEATNGQYNAAYGTGDSGKGESQDSSFPDVNGTNPLAEITDDLIASDNDSLVTIDELGSAQINDLEDPVVPQPAQQDQARTGEHKTTYSIDEMIHDITRFARTGRRYGTGITEILQSDPVTARRVVLASRVAVGSLIMSRTDRIIADKRMFGLVRQYVTDD